MSVAPYWLTIFMALNVARAIAYWPQIVSIYRNPDRASAVSLWTWNVFTAAVVATVIYALAALGDLIVAAGPRNARTWHLSSDFKALRLRRYRQTARRDFRFTRP